MNSSLNKDLPWSVPAASHKPRMITHRGSSQTYFECSDGVFSQFGNTEQEAYSNLMKFR